MKAKLIGWERRPLSACGKWLSGGTPPRSTTEYWGGDIPWISAKSLTSFFVYDADEHVTELGAENGTRRVPANTVLFVVRGMSLKSEFRMGLTTRSVTFNQDLKAIIPADDIEPRFLAYALKSREFDVLGMVGSAAHGTGKLSTDHIGELALLIPALPVQRRIADILSAYDDLIENNNRRMALLEESIHLLYREWFVYLRFPGHERTKIVDGVPEGWRRVPFHDFVDCQYGYAFKSQRFTVQPEGLPVVRIRNVLAGTSPIFTTEEAHERYLLEDGDLLIGMDGDFHMNLWQGGKAWLNQRVARLRPATCLPTAFAWAALRRPVSDFNSTIQGTTVKHLGDKHLKTIQPLVPPEPIRSEVAAQFAALGDEYLTLAKQSQKLREARDLLLPRLMDGRIPV